MRVTIGVILSSVAIAAAQTRSTPPPPHHPYGTGLAPFAHVSSTGCAAASCHGGGKAGQKGSEYTTWAPEANPRVPDDPHSRAYRTLFSADSQRMAAALNLPNAHTADVCLKCHAVQHAQPSEGVGCGACHGPAEKWLTAHYQSGWKQLSNREKWERYGFVPNGNLVAREATCAACHVGAADREVNHDLIAAGHPRLSFEYARFHFSTRYRKHWQEEQPQPDFEVRAWLIGRAVNLRAAAELLSARAERAAGDDPKTPWPEFAHSSCYACHQTFDTTGPRRSEATTNRSPGSLLWEPWHGTGIEVAARHSPAAFGVTAPEWPALKELQDAMTKRVPNPARVRSFAAATVTELDAWLAAVQGAEDRGLSRLPPGTPRRVIRDLAAGALDGEKLRDHDWDVLAARYLGCAAMYHADGGKATSPDFTAPLTALGDALRFPRGFHSPAGFGRDKLGVVRDQFRTLSVAGGR